MRQSILQVRFLQAQKASFNKSMNRKKQGLEVHLIKEIKSRNVLFVRPWAI